jgi:hypothetical protein
MNSSDIRDGGTAQLTSISWSLVIQIAPEPLFAPGNNSTAGTLNVAECLT